MVHAYAAANEPYDLYKGLSRSSPEYKALKEERAEVKKIDSGPPTYRSGLPVAADINTCLACGSPPVSLEGRGTRHTRC